MSTKPLIVFGAGDAAELAEYYFRTDAQRSISAFTVDQGYLSEGRFMGRPVLPFETIDQEFPPDQYDLFVAVGYSKLNTVRADKMREAAQKGYSLASYVSSRAYVWDGFERAPNQFILEGNTLQPYCRIGQGVTLWSGSHVAHHSTIGDYSFIAPRVAIAGRVAIGDYCFIGVNATLRDHITVGRRCVIGAGAIVLADAPDESVFKATPTQPSGVPSSRLRNI